VNTKKHISRRAYMAKVRVKNIKLSENKKFLRKWMRLYPRIREEFSIGINKDELRFTLRNFRPEIRKILLRYFKFVLRRINFCFWVGYNWDWTGEFYSFNIDLYLCEKSQLIELIPILEKVKYRVFG
jgi:hypothetical protein